MTFLKLTKPVSFIYLHHWPSNRALFDSSTLRYQRPFIKNCPERLRGADIDIHILPGADKLYSAIAPILNKYGDNKSKSIDFLTTDYDSVFIPRLNWFKNENFPYWEKKIVNLLNDYYFLPNFCDIGNLALALSIHADSIKNNDLKNTIFSLNKKLLDLSPGPVLITTDYTNYSSLPNRYSLIRKSLR